MSHDGQKIWFRPGRWIWLALVPMIVLAGIALALLSGLPATSQASPPPALSQAGRPIVGETYQWRHVAIGGGGFVTGLSMDPAGKTMVVRTDVYGAYIWDPALDRWSQLVTSASMPDAYRVQNGIADGAYEIVVAPSRPDRLYLAIKGRLFRSDDRGRNWIEPSAGDPFPFTWSTIDEYRTGGTYLAVSPRDPDLLLLGTPSAGLWRSADAGRDWQRVMSVPASDYHAPDGGAAKHPGILIWFDPDGGKSGGRLFAMSAGHGMFVSTDGGIRFAPLSTAAAQPRLLRRGAFARDGSFFGLDNEGQAVWVYRDGAWRNLTNSGGLPARAWTAIAVNPRADQLLVFDGAGQGYQTRDGGRNWSKLVHRSEPGPGDPPWLRVAIGNYFTTGDVAFDPVVPNRLWAATGVGVYRADLAPAGFETAWTSQTRGIEELVANDVVQPPGYPPAFAGWDFGIHVKSDLNRFSTTFAPKERGLMSVQQMDWTPARPGYVVTNASDVRMGCCAEDGNAVMAGTSPDGGANWTNFPSLPTPEGEKPDDPWRMSFGTIAVSSGDPANIVWEPAFNKTPFFTRDGGKSWQPVRLPGAIGPKPGSFPVLYYQRKTLAADKSLPGVFYLVHSGDAPNGALAGLWKTSDGGANWQKVFSGEIAPTSGLAAKLRAVPGKAGHLFFTSDAPYGDDTRLRRSVDGGVTWTAVPDVDHVDDIAFGKAPRGSGYPAIYLSGKVGGSYGVWRSVDAAASWQRLVDYPLGSLDLVTAIGADPDVFGRVYLGYKGSSWIWGEPAPCKPAPHRSGETDNCSAVGSPLSRPSGD